MPGFILIRQTVWPQYTNVTDRQDRTGQTDRQRSDIIGRTVLQTVDRKRPRVKDCNNMLQTCCQIICKCTKTCMNLHNIALKLLKFRLRLGSAPNPTRGTYNAAPYAIVG